MDMDENRANLSQMNSVLVGKAVYASMIDLSKKRKIENDQLGLPLPKHKFGDRSSSFVTCIVKENTDGGVSADGLKQLECPYDSNSFDSATSPYPAAKHEPEFLKVYTYNQPTKFETESPRTIMYDQPSTSSGSCGSNSFRSIIHVDSTLTEKISSREEESLISREPSGQILKNGLLFEENELPDFGKYTEYGMDEIKQCSDMEDHEMMLYSNEATSNLYVLSSGRWNVDQDARVDTKKPTIDQEFEQYFSMLML